MSAILIMMQIPFQVFANSGLKPLDGTIEVTVLNTPVQTGDTIKPDVEVKWEGVKPGDTKVTINGVDYIFSHYQIRLTDMVEKKTYLSESLGTKTAVKLQDIQFGFDLSGTAPSGSLYVIENGKAYKLEVIPVYAYRSIGSDGKPGEAKYDIASAPAQRFYFITDFDTKMQDSEEGLTLTWEYIPGADYQLFYTPSDKRTVEEFKKAQGGDIPVISDVVTQQVAEKNLIVEDGRTKVKYTIDQIVPGQIYSGYVVVNKYDTGESLKPAITNETIGATGPKVVKGIPAIDIKVNNIGNGRIKVGWKFQAWVGLDGSLEKVIVYGKGINESTYKPKIEVPNYSGTIESAILDEPVEETFYYVEFVFRDKNNKQYSIKSKEVLYTPFILRDEPLKPNVPKPYGDHLKEDIEQNVVPKNDYLVSKDEQRPITDPNFKENTFHSKVNEGKGIQVVWDAPTKLVDGVEVIDHELLYDVWITSDKNMIENRIDPIYKDIQITEDDQEHTIFAWNDDKVIGFKWLFDKYMTSSGKVEPIKPNQTYYIKIVAKRQYGSDFALSQPTTITITIDKNGEIARPPVLGKPPLQIVKTTIDSVTIKWRETWYEILAKDPTMYSDPDEKVLAQMGSGKVYLEQPIMTTGPAIRFKYEENRQEYPLYVEDEVNDVINKVGVERYKRDYYHRNLTLGKDVMYEMQVIPYNEVLAEITEGEGIEQWVAKQGDRQGWEQITPTNGTPPEEVWKFHTTTGLSPNTKYLMMIRAYRMVDGEKLNQTFPSYIIATTMTDYEEPETTPKVPNLNLNHKTDTEIGVWFTYNKNFDYEIVYSRLDDPNQANTWTFEISDDPNNKNYVPDGGKAIVTITGLFPDTTYNVWIRAKQKKGTGISEWSNPVSTKTDSIKAPATPSGLGPASYQSIIEIGQDFKPVTKDYITVEWTKDKNDHGIETSGSMEKRYEYILEFADNNEFLDALEVTVSDQKDAEVTPKDVEILAKNLVKFNQLISNRPYYVRIKARIVLTDTETKREISKESDFSDTVRILTKKSDDEYDGGENDNIVIYPDQIEESYENGIWTWEIVDAQSVISEILTKKDYFFTVDLTLYRDRYDASIRKLRLPKSVWDALVGQRMELKVETSYGVYQIPANSIAYATEKTNANQIIELEWRKIYPYDIQDVVKPYPYVLQKGEQLSITVQGKAQPITKVDGMIRAELKLDNPNDYLSKNMQGYTYDKTNGSWIKEQFSIQTRTDGTYLGFSTPRLGIYGLYYVSDYTLPSQMTSSMQTLIKRYEVEGLGTKFRKNDRVNSNQFILLMLGVTQNKSKIDLTATVPADMKDHAKASKLYISNNTGAITEEQAIHGVVRLYELTTGNKVKPSNKRVVGVSAAYEESVRKAYALGLINTINASAPITYGQLCDLIVQVLP